MNTTIHDQAGSVIAWPRKKYTQDEVDDLLARRDEEHLSRERAIKEVNNRAQEPGRLDTRKVADLVKKSNRILLSISSHGFPLDLFPDTINVEEGRITIINRHFLSSEVHSIDIADISNIFINTTIFFSQLVVISKTFEQNEIQVRNLRTEEAVFARRIIEGLRIFKDKHIDTCNYSKKELIAKLEELSTTEIVT